MTTSISRGSGRGFGGAFAMPSPIFKKGGIAYIRLSRRRRFHSRHFSSSDKWTDKAIKTHTRLVGEMVWAWNGLHQSFSYLFGLIVQSSDPSIGEAIWAALKSDSSQRDVLLASSKLRHGDKSAFGRRMRWAVNITEKLSVYRNDLVHTPMSGIALGPRGLVTVVSSHAISPARVHRLSRADTFKLLRTLRGDLVQLRNYVWDLGQRLYPYAIPMIGSWPDRPPLRTLKEFPLKDPSCAHRKTIKRRRRLSSSPP